MTYTVKNYFLELGISLPFLVVYGYCIFTLKTLLVIFKNHLKITLVRNVNPKQCFVPIGKCHLLRVIPFKIFKMQIQTFFFFFLKQPTLVPDWPCSVPWPTGRNRSGSCDFTYLEMTSHWPWVTANNCDDAATSWLLRCPAAWSIHRAGKRVVKKVDTWGLEVL